MIAWSQLPAALHRRDLSITRTAEILQLAGLLDDDRIPSFTSLARPRLALLPAPMAADVRDWLRTRSQGGPRSRPRDEHTVRMNFNRVHPLLLEWARHHTHLRAILVREADARSAAGRVAAVLLEAGRAEGTVRRHQVVLDRFAVFLAERGVDSVSDQVCADFIAEQTGVRLGSLREPVTDRAVQAVRRPVVLMADALAGRAVEADRTVVPAKDGCPAKFRPLRDDYLASCRRRGNAEATVVAKDRAVSRFLAYLDDVGAAGLAVLDVRDLSGFLLRQRRLRRKTIASMRSCLADFLDFLAAAGRAPRSLADRLPPQKYVRHESEPHLWTADEVRRTLAGIDRQSATGKRDYAMILATARLGLRISDLRHLELGDLDWRAKRITIIIRLVLDRILQPGDTERHGHRLRRQFRQTEPTVSRWPPAVTPTRRTTQANHANRDGRG